MGWGKGDSDTNHEDIPRQALIRAVNESICFHKDPSLVHIYSYRSFCAQGQDQGPCSGDSGGGFYVKFGGLWTLRGIVSAGMKEYGSGMWKKKVLGSLPSIRYIEKRSL